MKAGVSTYSMSRLIKEGRIDVLEAISRIAEMGAEHVEIVPIGYSLTDRPDLVDAIRSRAAECGLAISNYAIAADFSSPDHKPYEQEIERVMREVDIAERLGVKRMRHDVAFQADVSIARFLADLPRLAEACRQIADYAAPRGIVTSVENHGYYVQASDRVQMLIHEVDRPNFRTTLDIGNFLCVDEDPAAAVRNNIGYASVVHIKDFYIRPSSLNPGSGWFRSTSGKYLRGAIIGHGDIDMRAVLRIIKQSGYDGYLSVEFEGMEDDALGTQIGLENVKRIWQEV